MDEQTRHSILRLWNGLRIERERGHGGSYIGTCCSAVSVMIQGKKPTTELLNDIGELGDFGAAAFVTHAAYYTGPDLDGSGWLSMIHRKFLKPPDFGSTGSYVAHTFAAGYVLGLLQSVATQGSYDAKFSRQLIDRFPDIIVQLNDYGGALDGSSFPKWSEQVSQSIKEWLRLLERVERGLITELVCNIDTALSHLPDGQKIHRPVDTIAANIFHAVVEEKPASGRFRLSCLAAELGHG